MKRAEWVGCLAAIILTGLAAGGAQAEGPLPEGVAEILERAANRPEARYLVAAVELASEAYPELQGEIEDLARALTPESGGKNGATYAVNIARDTSPKPPADAAGSPAPAEGFFGAIGLHGEVEGGVDLSTGNTDEQTVNAKVELTLDRTLWRHKLNLEGDWTVDRKTTTKQRFLGSYETNYAYSNRAFVFGFLSFEDDRFSGFDYQISESVGAGYKLLDTPRFLLSVEAGPNARQSKVKPGGNTEYEYGGRVSSEFEWRLSKSATFSNEVAAFIGSERSSLDSSSALKLKINDRLSGKLSYDVHWDGNVPDGRKSTDTVTRGAVVYDF